MAAQWQCRQADSCWVTSSGCQHWHWWCAGLPGLLGLELFPCRGHKLCPVSSVQWHPRINQIFVGCGGKGGGCVRTFYDTKLSNKGALAAASRAPRVEATEFMSVSSRQSALGVLLAHCVLYTSVMALGGCLFMWSEVCLALGQQAGLPNLP